MLYYLYCKDNILKARCLSNQSDLPSLFQNYGQKTWSAYNSEEREALIFSQNFALFHYVYYMVTLSATFLHRVESIFTRYTWNNYVWLIGCSIVLVLQVCFFAVSVFWLNIGLSQVSWWIYVLSLTAPLAILTVSELIKSHDKKEWQKFQKRSKLEFSTKLGMHSPL